MPPTSHLSSSPIHSASRPHKQESKRHNDSSSLAILVKPMLLQLRRGDIVMTCRESLQHEKSKGLLLHFCLNWLDQPDHPLVSVKQYLACVVLWNSLECTFTSGSQLPQYRHNLVHKSTWLHPKLFLQLPSYRDDLALFSIRLHPKCFQNPLCCISDESKILWNILPLIHC